MNPNNNIKILLVDDEPDILEFVGYNLKKEGYQVLTAGNGEEAIQTARKEKPNLILLDVMMPGIDGIETCREIRGIKELKNTMITFLTARDEDYSQIAGFDAGADDYINKPIKPRVLVSRINALLRRAGNVNITTDPNELVLGDFKINREKYLVTYQDKQVYLPKKEFELLALLTSKPGKVFTRDEILNLVWGDEVVVGDRTIDVHIRKLREKFGESHIKTVKGVGYKFDF
ncbi:MAG: response regulator transcription factor [Bacteroidia bacterium]|nr:response regulator transcription factor [Bacteroidia bacterium]